MNINFMGPPINFGIARRPSPASIASIARSDIPIIMGDVGQYRFAVEVVLSRGTTAHAVVINPSLCTYPASPAVRCRLLHRSLLQQQYRSRAGTLADRAAHSAYRQRHRNRSSRSPAQRSLRSRQPFIYAVIALTAITTGFIVVARRTTSSPGNHQCGKSSSRSVKIAFAEPP